MQSRAARLGVLGAAVVAAVVLFIVLQDNNGDDGDGGGSTTTGAAKTTGTVTNAAPSVDVLTVRDGQPLGGVKTLTYDKGDQVRVEVRLNTPEEEVHVHGYEISEPAEQSPVRLSFPAKLDGIFEIELHGLDGSEEQIAELRVNP
jgi:FtsP/CotA-like multicopper oxidase with cupredoxin domain